MFILSFRKATLWCIGVAFYISTFGASSLKAQSGTQKYFSNPINTAGITVAAFVLAATLYSFTGKRLKIFLNPSVLLKTEKPLNREQVKNLIESTTHFRWVISDRNNEDLFSDAYHNYIQIKYKYGKKYKHRIRIISTGGRVLNPLISDCTLCLIGFNKTKGKKRISIREAKQMLGSLTAALHTLSQE